MDYSKTNSVEKSQNLIKNSKESYSKVSSVIRKNSLGSFHVFSDQFILEEILPWLSEKDLIKLSFVSRIFCILAEEEHLVTHDLNFSYFLKLLFLVERYLY